MATQSTCTSEVPHVNHLTYADYLKSQGQTVVELAGMRWMKYQGALIPTTAMPVFVELSHLDAVRALKSTGSVFLRYTTTPDAQDKQWWHVVCRRYDVAHVSANTRSKIHRGLKRLQVTRASAQWVAENGYDCHVNSYQRYKHAAPLTKAEFQRFMKSLCDQPLFEVWICTQSDELMGYIVCVCEQDGVFMHTIDLSPRGLHDYAAYAMLHRLLEYYVCQRKTPVTNGTRSIAHATDMQDFLGKFGFEREYGKLHVIYRRDVELAVRLLYPFRRVLRWFEAFPLLHKVCAVLWQEEIVRRQYGPHI